MPLHPKEDYMYPTNHQQDKKLLTATDVADILHISRSSAYRIIQRLNVELKAQCKITIAGKISSHTFLKMFIYDL